MRGKEMGKRMWGGGSTGTVKGRREGEGGAGGGERSVFFLSFVAALTMNGLFLTTCSLRIPRS